MSVTGPAAGEDIDSAWVDSVTSEVNGLLGSVLRAIRSSDSSARTSTTVADDDTLTLPVKASTVYDVDMMLDFVGDATGDAKFTFTMPAGATLSIGGVQIDTASALAVWYKYQVASAFTALAVGVAGATSDRPTTGRGTLRVAGTAGTFTLQWAANAAGTGTILRADSRITLTEPQS